MKTKQTKDWLSYHEERVSRYHKEPLLHQLGSGSYSSPRVALRHFFIIIINNITTKQTIHK